MLSYMLEPRKTEAIGYNSPRTGKEMYSKIENIIHIMRKTRLIFFRRIERMGCNRLAKQAFEKVMNFNIKPARFTETLGYYLTENITTEIIHNMYLHKQSSESDLLVGE